MEEGKEKEEEGEEGKDEREGEEEEGEDEEEEEEKVADVTGRFRNSASANQFPLPQMVNRFRNSKVASATGNSSLPQLGFTASATRVSSFCNL